MEVLVAVRRRRRKGRRSVRGLRRTKQKLNSHERRRHSSYPSHHTKTLEARSDVEDESSALPSDGDLREIFATRKNLEHRRVDLKTDADLHVRLGGRFGDGRRSGEGFEWVLRLKGGRGKPNESDLGGGRIEFGRSMIDGVHDLDEEWKDVRGDGVAGSMDGGVDEKSGSGGDFGEGEGGGGRGSGRDLVVVLAPHRDRRKDEDLWIPRLLRRRSTVQSSSEIHGVRVGVERDMSGVELESRLHFETLLLRDRRGMVDDNLCSLSVKLLEVVLESQPIESLLPLFVDVDEGEDVAWES